MKITLCGSISFFDQMFSGKEQLEKLGHEVDLPPTQVKNEAGVFIPVQEYYLLRKETTDTASGVWEKKKEAMINHFQKIAWADCILVTNYKKNDVEGYIGANTLMEMGLALHLQKPIYLLQEIPEMSYKEEILGMKPIIIYNDLSLIHNS